MMMQTNWEQMEATGRMFQSSRWPEAGEGILALLPYLRSESAFQEAWIRTSLGTIIISFPSLDVPRFNIYSEELRSYQVYWYLSNYNDKQKIEYTLALDEVVPFIMRCIQENDFQNPAA
jgi:hypothetical protein